MLALAEQGLGLALEEVEVDLGKLRILVGRQEGHCPEQLLGPV